VSCPETLHRSIHQDPRGDVLEVKRERRRGRLATRHLHAGRGEHVFEERLELAEVHLDLGERVARRVGVALLGEIEGDANPGEGRPELVRDVREQLLLRAHEPLDALGHLVEGPADLSDLVAP
jgi:hypothetical protein